MIGSERLFTEGLAFIVTEMKARLRMGRSLIGLVRRFPWRPRGGLQVFSHQGLAGVSQDLRNDLTVVVREATWIACGVGLKKGGASRRPTRWRVAAQPWMRRRRSTIASEPRTSERALPKEAGSISGTAEAAVALTVIMYGWAEDVFQAPPRLVR